MNNAGEKPTYQGCQRVRYWLAELDRYGNPTLIDGMHSDILGVQDAIRIIRGLRNGPSRQFAYAKVILEPSPDNPPRNRERVCSSTEEGIVCGKKESAHTIEAAKGDVGMDHRFIPATWDDNNPMPE